MAIAYTFSTASTLRGARDFNRIHRAAAQDDVGSKVAFLISQMNLAISNISNLVSTVSSINSAISTIHKAIASAIAASQVSALSAPGLVSGGATMSGVFLSTISAMSAISNFRA